MEYKVFGLGNALMDLEFLVEDDFLDTHQLIKGQMGLSDLPQQQALLDALGQPNNSGCGGSAANTIVALAHFGNPTYFTGRVSQDEWGTLYAQDLQTAKIDSNLHQQQAHGNTGTCVVMVTPDAERTMSTHLGSSADFSTDDVPLDLLEKSEYLYMEGYLCTADNSFNALMTAKKHAAEKGVKQVLSLSDPGVVQHFRTQMKALLEGGIELLFCNEQEALDLAETDSIEKAAEFISQYSRTFTITLGSKGALIFDGTDYINVPGQEVKAIDTLGAGDSYAGAFLHALLHGHSYQTAGEFACKVAAKLITSLGPRLSAEDYHDFASDLNQGAKAD
jgi:sugar/nucleoside kinase (ribokinase family)